MKSSIVIIGCRVNRPEGHYQQRQNDGGKLNLFRLNDKTMYIICMSLLEFAHVVTFCVRDHDLKALSVYMLGMIIL